MQGAVSAYMKIIAARNKATAAEPDWAKYSETLDADMLATVKTMVADEIAKAEASLPEYTAELDASFAEFKTAMNGPGGLVRPLSPESLDAGHSTATLARLDA
jgi:hypothetical protein